MPHSSLPAQYVASRGSIAVLLPELISDKCSDSINNSKGFTVRLGEDPPVKIFDYARSFESKAKILAG